MHSRTPRPTGRRRRRRKKAASAVSWGGSGQAKMGLGVAVLHVKGERHCVRCVRVAAPCLGWGWGGALTVGSLFFMAVSFVL
mmetsp:Transcript_29204/g.57135  ORF Transcript_29204/g.57135 Transcript_29204/m.57135 type:complete len:82 (+) Transcript_29204:151-396(+)